MLNNSIKKFMTKLAKPIASFDYNDTFSTFKGKGKALSTLAVLGGMAAPWALNLPSTLADVNRLKGISNEDWAERKDSVLARSHRLSGIDPSKPYGAPVDSTPDPTSKAGGYIPMDLQIAKTHLADVLSEQLSSGYVDYGQAVGLMQRANAESNKPWITVQNLAHAAVGAGAGALAGTVAAKGIGLFMNLDPGEQKVIRNTGAALGTLINLGKFGF